MERILCTSTLQITHLFANLFIKIHDEDGSFFLIRKESHGRVKGGVEKYTI